MMMVVIVIVMVSTMNMQDFLFFSFVDLEDLKVVAVMVMVMVSTVNMLGTVSVQCTSQNADPLHI